MIGALFELESLLLALTMGYTLGVMCTVDTLRMYDNDLYLVWMHRRKERKRRK